jgi:hypothetical protein
VNSDREQQQHKGEGERSGASAAAQGDMRKAAESIPAICITSIISTRTQLGIVIDLFHYYEVLSSRSIQNENQLHIPSRNRV